MSTEYTTRIEVIHDDWCRKLAVSWRHGGKMHKVEVVAQDDPDAIALALMRLSDGIRYYERSKERV